MNGTDLTVPANQVAARQCPANHKPVRHAMMLQQFDALEQC